VESVVWFVAQIKHSADGEWQTVGMSSDRAAAVKMVGSGYRDARTSGLGPYAARVVRLPTAEAFIPESWFESERAPGRSTCPAER